MSLNLPWKFRIPLFIFSKAVSASCRRNFTVNRRLWSFFDYKFPPSETPKDGVKTSDFIIDASRDLWFRLYIPTSALTSTSVPLIIYMHGGGFCFFNVDSIACEFCCRQLASRLNCIVASINYRLAPEHRFPCQYDDCFDALKFLDENFGSYLPPVADAQRCFLLGDSAGGNLIHHSAVRASGYDFQKLKIIGLVSIQPFFGGEERTEPEIRLRDAPVLNLERSDWFWKAFLPEGSDREHPAANVFGPKADNISGVKFPPILLVIGGFDLLQEWQRRYYEGMKKEGNEVILVEYPYTIHGFWGIDLPESTLFFKELKDFMQKQSDKSNSVS